MKEMCDCFYSPVKCNCKIIELHKNFVEIASKETIVDRLVEMSETIEELEKQNKEMFDILMGTWNTICNDDNDFDRLKEFVENNTPTLEEMIDE